MDVFWVFVSTYRLMWIHRDLWPLFGWMGGGQAHVPRQQFFDAIHVMIGDSAEYSAQIQLRVDAV